MFTNVGVQEVYILGKPLFCLPHYDRILPKDMSMEVCQVEKKKKILSYISMFSSESFIALILYICVYSPFQFSIFTEVRGGPRFHCGCYCCYSFLFSHRDSQLPQCHLLKKPSFLHRIFLHLCQNSIDYKMLWSISGVCSVALFLRLFFAIITLS